MLLGNPVAFTIGNFNVYWYGIIITGAILGGTLFAFFEARRRKLSSDYVLTLFLWVVPLAVIFARLSYVLFHIQDFFPITSFQGVIDIISTRDGGISIIGAVPGGALGIFFASKTNKISYIETLDMVAPCMILGQALGRWGNFVNQELYGQQILNEAFQKFPIAVQIDRHIVYDSQGNFIETIYNGWFQATFFYEMVLNYIGFAVLLVLSRKCKKNGIIFVGYLAWYAVVRAVMESIRTDAVSVNGVKIGVVGCIIAAVIAVLFIVLIWLGKIRSSTPSHLLKAECINTNGMGINVSIDDDNNGSDADIEDCEVAKNNGEELKKSENVSETDIEDKESEDE